MTRRSSRVSQKKVSTVDPASQTQPSYETTASRVIAQQPLTSRPVRSTRRRVVKTQDKDASEDANEDEYKDGGGQSSSKRRKRKNTKMPDEFRKVRGRRGLLEGLTKDVPLDIIYEIFSYLETSDLLTLARTTRDLRSTLMSKTSEFMWRTARLNLDDLPPLPKDLSEPQYADLLFGTHCYLCSKKTGCIPTFWSFRTRCCRPCALKTYPYLQSLRRAQPQDYRDANILPREVIPGIFREHSKSTPARHVGHTALTMRLRDEYDSLTDEEEITAWVTRKWEEEEAIRTHGQLCHKWYSDMLQKREDRLLEERKDAILRNLEDWGLREEAEIIINSPNPRLFLKHEGVDEPKKLTTHAWNQMKEELVELLSDHRERRIAEIVKAAALERYEKLHKSYNEIVTNVDFREPFPLAEDVLDDQVCEELVWNTPPEIDLTSDFLSLQIAQFMPSFIQRWKSAKVLELVNKIKEVVPTFAMSDLQLATTIFRCGRCSRKMHFPEMFYHRCCREPLSSNHSRMKIFTEKSPLFQRKAPWNSSFIHLYNGPSMIVVQDVIKACGLEPETASIHDLYAAHPLIECLHCARYNGDRHFMRFHDLLGHFTGSSTYTVTINSFGDETEDILRCERFCLDQFRCAHCHAEIGNRAIDVSKHLEERHPEMLLMFDEKPHRFDTAQESPSEPTLKSLQDHWYWNTRRNFKSFYESRLDSTFRYRKATTGSS